MKTGITSLVSIITLTATLVHAQPKVADAFEQNKKLGRGVNIIGYDPIWRSKEQGRFQEKHFRLLKEAGFNSVRINLHGFRQMNVTNGWALRDSWFDVLDWAMKHAQAQGLFVILDLHEFNALGNDPEGNKEKFLAFWRQISARYRDAPASVVFEILNEPSQKLTPTLWNGYLREALAIIRGKNPTRTVIVGPAFWNSVDHLPELELPDSDRNLIVTVHYYKPMEFTHQGASWTNQRDKLGVDWLGTPNNLAPPSVISTKWRRGPGNTSGPFTWVNSALTTRRRWNRAHATLPAWPGRRRNAGGVGAIGNSIVISFYTT
jgi:endoglucanase